MFPNAYGKVGGVAVTTANPLDAIQNTLDVFVVKYDSLGKSVWAARIGSTALDIGYKIATDTLGNVYVTGQSGIGVRVTAFNADGSAFGPPMANAGSNDAFIVKYNTNGVVQWITRIASAGVDIGFSIATDSSGNVYVTGQGGSGVVITAFNADGTAFGTTLANSGSNDAFIVKYNTSGVVQWVTRIGSTGVDIGYGIATDSSGNAYVTGQGASISIFNSDGNQFGSTLTTIGGTDVFVVKYNTNGFAQWVARVTSTVSEIGYGITTDTSGNVYVTGSGGSGATLTIRNSDATLFGTIANSGGTDAFIVKYNTNGFAQWGTRIATTGSDIGRDIATDSSGNVYVTGQGSTATITVFNSDGNSSGRTLTNTGGGDAFVVKYNTNGFAQWAAKIASSATDIGYGIATDSSGNVYVTGQGGSNAAVSAFNANGTSFGTLTNMGVNDVFIVKYDTNGVVQWATKLASNVSDIGYSITIDQNSNIYATGSFVGGRYSIYGQSSALFSTIPNAGGTDVLVVKYNTNGVPQWVARVASTGSEVGYAIDTDNSGNVYVTGIGGNGVVITAYNADGSAFGTTLPNSGQQDAFIVKYNANGVVQWAARIASTSVDIGYGIATDSSGNVYVTGQGGVATVTAFNADGTAFGTTLSNAGGTDIIIVKYNTNGFVQWVNRLTTSSADVGYGIDTDSSGNVYVTGQGGAATITVFNSDNTIFGSLTNTGGGDAYVVKYNTDGFAQWAAKIASSVSDIGYAITTDSSDNVYVAGRSGNTSVTTLFNSDGNSSGRTLTNTGGGDAFVVKYNTNGFAQWGARIGTTSADFGFGIVTDSSGNVYIIGYAGAATITIRNSDDTPFGTLANSGSNDAFIVKYNTNGFAQWATRVASAAPDIGYAIDTDTSGNVYFTVDGPSTFTAFNSNGDTFINGRIDNGAIILKYDTNGFGRWAQLIRSATNTTSNPSSMRGISVDSLGNAHIVGSSGGGVSTQIYNIDMTPYKILNVNNNSIDIFIVKYSSNTIPLWATKIDISSSGSVNDIVTDNSGNIYVTGQATSAFATFNADGTQFGTTIANSGGTDAYIIKYNTDGFVQWVARVASTGTDSGNAITTDTSGNAYVTGSGGQGITVTVFNADGSSFGTTLANSGQTDAFVVKYNTNGLVQWVARIASADFNSGNGIATDSSGNVYVGGTCGTSVVTTAFNENGTAFSPTLPNAGTSDIFVVKYNTDGDVQWIARVNGSLLFDIAADTSGNVYAIGNVTSGITTTAYSANGAAFGTTFTNSGNNATSVVKYNTSGSVQWFTRITACNGGRMTTDSSGNVYVTGYTASGVVMTIFNANGTQFGTVSSDIGSIDAFIVKYNTNGVAQWAARVASTGTDFGYDIVTDSSGNVYLIGQGGAGVTVTAYNSNDIPLGSTFINASQNTSDTFVVKYDSSGIAQWISVMGGFVTDEGRGIAVDTSNNIYAAGTFSTSALIPFDA